MYGHQVLNQFEQTSYFITKSWFYTEKPDSTDDQTTVYHKEQTTETFAENNMSDQDRMRKFIMEEISSSKKRHFLGQSLESEDALLSSAN